ncbi:hypothetical protein ACSLBF_06815 [Pseudoalteromonas sp. T1lg65]|uniref:hypothetical protein n=1 Tax=Pseudoalteromonas sp. T1lg65 TaxID=2077101 RepID=UPI003F790F77
MNKTFKLASHACLLLTASLANAKIEIPDVTLKDCQPPESNRPDKAKRFIMCLDENIDTLERNRQAWINKLILDTKTYQQESGNTALLPIIERALKNQAEYMEDSCRWRYLLIMPNSTKAATAYKECKIRFIKQHILEIKQGSFG